MRKREARFRFKRSPTISIIDFRPHQTLKNDLKRFQQTISNQNSKRRNEILLQTSSNIIDHRFHQTLRLRHVFPPIPHTPSKTQQVTILMLDEHRSLRIETEVQSGSSSFPSNFPQPFPLPPR